MAWPRSESTLKLFVLPGKIKKAMTVVSLLEACEEISLVFSDHCSTDCMCVKAVRVLPGLLVAAFDCFNLDFPHEAYQLTFR